MIDVNYLEIIISIEIQLLSPWCQLTHYSDTGDILDKIKIGYRQN